MSNKWAARGVRYDEPCALCGQSVVIDNDTEVCERCANMVAPAAAPAVLPKPLEWFLVSDEDIRRWLGEDVPGLEIAQDEPDENGRLAPDGY